MTGAQVRGVAIEKTVSPLIVKRAFVLSLRSSLYPKTPLITPNYHFFLNLCLFQQKKLYLCTNNSLYDL